MYAVVTSGGKQYRVEAGSELTVERVPGDAGATITFDRVLLVGDGEAVTVGTPTVEGATVSGTVLGETLGPKLIIFKFKQKAHYRRKNGHRQHLTRIRIDEISANGKTAKPAAKAKAQADKPDADASAAEARATADADAAAKPARRPRTKAATASKDASATAEAKPKTTRTRKSAAKMSEPAAEPEE